MKEKTILKEDEKVEVKEIKKVVPKVKTVKVSVTHTFRYAKKWCDNTTKTLPEDVANWMVKKRYGNIL